MKKFVVGFISTISISSCVAPAPNKHLTKADSQVKLIDHGKSHAGVCVLYVGLNEKNNPGKLGQEPEYSNKNRMRLFKCKPAVNEDACNETIIDAKVDSKLWHFYSEKNCQSKRIKTYLTDKNMNEGF